MQKRSTRQILMLMLTASCGGLAGCAPDPVVTKTVATCGSWTSDRYLADSTTGAFGTGGSGGFATGVSGGIRVYSWAFQVTNMCLTTPTADNAIQFAINFRADTAPDLTVIGYVYHSAADPADATPVMPTRRVAPDGIFYDGLLIPLDLTSASSDGKTARILVELEVTFQTTGTTAGDLARLKSALRSIQIDSFYHLYIGN